MGVEARVIGGLLVGTPLVLAARDVAAERCRAAARRHVSLLFSTWTEPMSQVRSTAPAAFVTRPRATALPLICAFLDRPMRMALPGCTPKRPPAAQALPRMQ